MNNRKLATLEQIDRLSHLVQQAKAIPLTGKIMLDREEMSVLLTDIARVLPDDLKRAQEVLDLEHKIIEDSNRQAVQTVEQANAQAQSTVESANAQAQATVAEAQNRASETLHSASDQANAMIADAQARANATLADAQARAQKMVSESEIIARAQAEAQEMLESAHRECEDYTARVQGAMNHLMEVADVSLSQQLDSLRALRQELAVNQ